MKCSTPKLKDPSTTTEKKPKNLKQNNGQCNRFITQTLELDWEVPGKTAPPAPVKC